MNKFEYGDYIDLTDITKEQKSTLFDKIINKGVVYLSDKRDYVDSDWKYWVIEKCSLNGNMVLKMSNVVWFSMKRNTPISEILGDMRHFKTGNWIDIRGLSNKEKRVLMTVMKYNGVKELNSTFGDCFENSWDVVFITEYGKINATNMVYKDRYNLQKCNELTPQEAAFMGAPDSLTVVGAVSADRIFWFNNINEGKPLHGWKIVANEEIISMDEVVMDKNHGWTPEDAIFKREGTMSGVDKQIEKLQADLEELKLQRQQELEATKKVEKWEPQGGNWYVGLRGVPKFADDGAIPPSWHSFGVTHPTEALAEKAANQMRTHNRLLAYVHEHAPDYEFQRGKPACNFFIKEVGNGDYSITQHTEKSLGTVYMPYNIACVLCKKLKEGIVEL